MRSSDRLAGFVAEALRAGHPRSEIAAAAGAAGWSEPEVARAMDDWSESRFPIPVPRPSAAVSAREALVYGLLFVSLGVSVVQIVALGFELIELWLPDPAETNLGLGTWRIRGPVASLVVFVPLFLWLNFRVARATRADRGLRRSAVRDWLGHGALFLVALIVLGDLISVLSAALGGELSARFLAKAALVAGVAGLVGLYFRSLVQMRDAR